MTSGPGCACERVRELRILISAATPVDTSSRSANLAKLQRARSCETMPHLPLARCSLDPLPVPSEKNVHSGTPGNSETGIRALSPRNVGQGVRSCWKRKVHVYFARRNLPTGTYAPQQHCMSGERGVRRPRQTECAFFSPGTDPVDDTLG